MVETSLQAQEDLCKAFVELIQNYFVELTKTKVLFSTPYLDTNFDYDNTDLIGMIRVSGICKGVVCILASHEMLSQLLKTVFKSELQDSKFMADALGEMTNMVAGNARLAFGTNFIISIPSVYTKEHFDYKFPNSTIVIPFNWHDNNLKLLIGFNETVELKKTNIEGLAQ